MTYKVASVHKDDFAVSTALCAQRKCDAVGIVVDNLVNSTSLGVFNHSAECLVQTSDEAGPD